jgi:hypothetical protein
MTVGTVLGCNADIEGPLTETYQAEVGSIAQGVVFNNHDYLFVTTPKNWYDARTYCANQGYYLVTIDDAQEEAFLNDQEWRRGLNNWWIGFNDLQSEGWWNWTGAPSTTSYSNWHPGEPNNQRDEDCALDRWEGDDRWNDGGCVDGLPFICEKELSSGSSFFYSASGTSSATVNTYNHYVYVPAGRILTVGTCGVAGASGTGDTYLRLNNPSGQEIASNDDAGDSCGVLSNFSILTSVSGTYVIRAGCWSSGSCSGTVAFTF